MATPISYCKICPRIGSHVHYSTLHDALVKLGVGAFISAEIISFVAGAVRGSTTLYFDPSTIYSYNTVSDKITQLIAPYQTISYLSYVFEVATLSFAIIAGVTLHSSSKRKLHRAALVLGFICGVLTLASRYYYNTLTAQALSALPTLFFQSTLSAYSQAEQQFQSAYGFWGAPADYIVDLILIVSVGSLGAALATTHPRLVWTRNESSQPATISERIKQAQPISENLTTNNGGEKYCRYCGVLIPSTSKFCEECGKPLA